MKKKKKSARSGFTILELLIVIGIVALLAAIIFAFVKSSRSQAQDAATKEVLSNVRTVATEEKNETGSYSHICTSGRTYDTITSHAQQQGLTSGQYGCGANVDSFAVVFPLQAEEGYWCVDAGGRSETVDGIAAHTDSKSCTSTTEGEGDTEGEVEGGGIPVVPPVADAGADQTIALPISTVSLSGSGSGGSGTISSYLWTKVSGGTATIATPDSSATSITGLGVGSYTFRLTVTDSNGQSDGDDVVIIVNNEAAGEAYNGVIPIPGKIEAEDFNTGGQNLAYYDSTAGNSGNTYRTSERVDIGTTSNEGASQYHVGWITNNEWMKYTIDVVETGYYTVKARVSSSSSALKTVTIEVDGQEIGEISFNSTGGWQTWQTYTLDAPVLLSEGTHVVRFLMGTTSSSNTNVGFNINYVQLDEVPSDGGIIPSARTLDVRGPVMVPQYGPYTSASYYESLPRGYYSSPTRDWPLIIFMHGSGESTPGPITEVLQHGIPKWIDDGHQLEFTVNGTLESFVVIAPHTNGWHPYLVDRFIEYAKANYNIDESRIYLTGLSAGTLGSIYYPSFSPEYGESYAQKIAAIVPVDGVWAAIPTSVYTPYDSNNQATLDYCYIPKHGIPTWLFSSTGHNPNWMTQMKAILDACNPAPNPAVQLTFYSGQSNAWTRAYDPTYMSPNIYEWMLQYTNN